MPDGILPNEGLPVVLQFWLRQAITGVVPWKLWLFQNDLTPTATTVLADVIPSSWSGYHELTMFRDSWQAPVVSAGCATIQWGAAPYYWTVSGGEGETVYGWAIVDDLANQLRWIQRFDDVDIFPVVVGEQFGLLPVITGTSAPCSSLTALKRVRRRRPRGH